MIDTSQISPLVYQQQNHAAENTSRLARVMAADNKPRMNDTQIEKTAKDFESMFVAQMLEQMFGESLGDDLFGDKQTDEVYKGLMMEEYGKEIAKAGGIGIADYVKRELLRLQEV